MSKFNLQDGCYIDGHWGQYATARMIVIAEDLGFDDTELIAIAHKHLASMSPSDSPMLTDDEWEAMLDSSDEVEQWLNANVADDQHQFGWSDGEFFYMDNEWWSEVEY